MTQWHKFPTHAITSTTSSVVDIVIKRATFLEWNHRMAKCRFESTECQLWHSVWHRYDYFYVFSAMKTVGLVSKVYVLRNYWPE